MTRGGVQKTGPTASVSLPILLFARTCLPQVGRAQDLDPLAISTKMLNFFESLMVHHFCLEVLMLNHELLKSHGKTIHQLKNPVLGINSTQ